ncbi:MAG: hypothetical protein AB1649_00085 [Chloroflexota bacterium]
MRARREGEIGIVEQVRQHQEFRRDGYAVGKQNNLGLVSRMPVNTRVGTPLMSTSSLKFSVTIRFESSVKFWRKPMPDWR